MGLNAFSAANGVSSFTLSKTSREVTDALELTRVEIFYAHANMGRVFIDHAVKLGVKGIVIAGVGDGHMPRVAVDG